MFWSQKHIWKRRKTFPKILNTIFWFFQIILHRPALMNVSVNCNYLNICLSPQLLVVLTYFFILSSWPNIFSWFYLLFSWKVIQKSNLKSIYWDQWLVQYYVDNIPHQWYPTNRDGVAWSVRSLHHAFEKDKFSSLAFISTLQKNAFATYLNLYHILRFLPLLRYKNCDVCQTQM